MLLPAKMILLAEATAIAGISFVGLGFFGTYMWIAYLSMATAALLTSVVLLSIRRIRSTIPEVTFALLSVYQYGQSWYYARHPVAANDPAIPIDNFVPIVLCMVAAMSALTISRNARTD